MSKTLEELNVVMKAIETNMVPYIMPKEPTTPIPRHIINSVVNEINSRRLNAGEMKYENDVYSSLFEKLVIKHYNKGKRERDKITKVIITNKPMATNHNNHGYTPHGGEGCHDFWGHC